MPIIALLVMAISVIINAIMSELKIHYGKKENSIALISDGIHSRIDVLSSLGVFIGLILANYWVFIDQLLAFLIGLYIIKESFSLGKEAIDSLLDVSAPPEIEEKIKEIIKRKGIKLESLKTQKKGSVYTADLEINLPKNLRVEEATKISEKLKEELMKEIKNLLYITIQIKSHDVETGFFKPIVPLFCKELRWQKMHRFGKGPLGFCFCPKCGYKLEHKRGIPCSTLICPNCKIPLRRE